MNAFNRYAPFIQDFIYAHDWENLRSIQVAAADAIFNTEDKTREPQVRGSFHGTRCTPCALYSRTYVLFCAILFFTRFGREGANVNAFNRYAPFIQDFIYAHDWENLRSIQVAAADAIFNTEDNVLFTASTASGKTEAAFFPILTEFWENPPASGKTEAAFFPILTEFWENPPATVGALYIGPLKALINDQFQRLDALCEEAEIPVWRWHGDVSSSHKAKLLKKPSGILQITPESLEALLLHRHAAVGRLFGDLRYVAVTRRSGVCLATCATSLSTKFTPCCGEIAVDRPSAS